MEHQRLDLEKLLRVPQVDPYGGFEVSPDGTRVAFSWNLTGQWEIYEMPLDLAAPSRQITTGLGAKFSPRYAPRGGRLAYALDVDGSECFDIYVYDFVTGEHTNLTPDTPEALQPNFSWSPDGSRIAFISDRSGRFDTYVMPATGGAGRLVFGQPHPDWDVHWSPDGRWLAVVAETRGQDYGTFIVPAEGSDPHAGGKPRLIAGAGGPINARDARWSPDSARIAFSSDVSGFFDVGVYELETGQIAWVTGGTGDKETPVWSPDGRRMAYVWREGPLTSLAVLELGKATPALYQVAPGIHSTPRFSPDGQHVLLIFDNPSHPGDLWSLSLADGSRRQLTCSLPPALQALSFVMPTAVHYPGMDGTPVPALLYRPPQPTGPGPAVIYVHGGPNWLAQVTWAPPIQAMVSRGWAVLAPNYRGSIGFGRDWQVANRFDLGGVDTEDVVAGADCLVREGIADPRRIAVTGRSHGGYLTMTALTQYPDRWAAGCAIVPFLNWFTSHAHVREDLRHWDIENLGDPAENYDLWRARSPFFFLERIEAPVQFISGANDIRCPASEALEARDVLVAHGRPCDLVLYPDEGHGFLKIENVVDAEKRRVAFLAQALEKPVV